MLDANTTWGKMKSPDGEGFLPELEKKIHYDNKNYLYRINRIVSVLFVHAECVLTGIVVGRIDKSGVGAFGTDSIRCFSHCPIHPIRK